jgi:hypothetical protein
MEDERDGSTYGSTSREWATLALAVWVFFLSPLAH